MEEQKHNDELKKLFAAKKSGSLDDFEREALDGFGALSSEEEAHELKANLDKRIHSELFAEKKKSFAYWYAAAGLILVAGFSIYFLRNNDNILPQNSVAMEQTKEAQTSTPADMSPAKPAEGEVKNEETASSEDMKLERKSADLSDAKQAGTGPQNDNRQYRRSEAPKASGEFKNEAAAGAVTVFEKESSGKKAAEGEEVSLSPNEPSENQKPADELRESKKDQGEVASRSKQQTENVMAPSEEVSQPGKERLKESKKKENALSKKTAVPSKAQDREKNDIPKSETGAYDRDDKNTPASVSQGAAGPGYTPVIHSEYAFYKQLKEKLKSGGLNREFSARLRLDKESKVEKVEFISAENFSSKEKKELIKILKSLEKAAVDGNTGGKDTFEYQLNYKP